MKRTIDKLMLDLERSISKRDEIYNKLAANNIRLKRKTDIKILFLKKINDLRMDIKKIQKVIIYYIVSSSSVLR